MLFLWVALTMAGNGQPTGEEDAVGFAPRTGQQVPLQATFRDTTGRRVILGEFFGTRPVILVMGYGDCPMLCSQVGKGLLEGLQGLEARVGERFDVLQVSIDPSEDPARVARTRQSYLKHYGRPGSEDGWHAVTGEEPAIRALAEAVGFGFRALPESGDFAHPAGLIILTADGKVSGYLYGLRFKSGDLERALGLTADNQASPPRTAFQLLCNQYGSVPGAYGAVILIILKVLGVLTLLGVAVAVAGMVRRERRAAG
jgi:protein SCO1/2